MTGRSCAAYGGSRESVTEGITGTFFERCEPGALAEAVRAFDAPGIDPRACRAAAERFGAGRFCEQLKRIVAEAVRDERAPRPEERASTRGLAGVSKPSRVRARTPALPKS